MKSEAQAYRERDNAAGGATANQHLRAVLIACLVVLALFVDTSVALAAKPEAVTPPTLFPSNPHQSIPVRGTTGVWANEPTGFNYQWRRCNALGHDCKNIAGATSATYTVAEADVGHTLDLVVTATNSEGSASAVSSPTGKVRPFGQTEAYSFFPESVAGAITAGPDGNLWFASNRTNNRRRAIAKITPSGTVTEYELHSSHYIAGITAGPDGNLWFTEGLVGPIGKITTSGAITEYPLPEGTRAVGIAAGPDGNLWFTDHYHSTIGKITTSGVVTQYSVENEPFEITPGPDGNLWFTAQNRIGKITTSGTVTEYAVPPRSDPHGILAGPDGNLWFTNRAFAQLGGAIGKITTSGEVTEYALPVGSEPSGLAIGPEGEDLWFTNSISGSKMLGRVTTTGTVAEWPAATSYNQNGLALGADGRLWYTNEHKVTAFAP